MSEELKRFFLSLDLPLIDVFGMSETSGGIIFNFEKRNLKTIGKPMRGIEVQIHEPNENGEGEVCIDANLILLLGPGIQLSFFLMAVTFQRPHKFNGLPKGPGKD